MKINLRLSRIFFHTLEVPLGKTTLVKGDMVIEVCKQRLIFTMTIRLKCPFVDVEHHWKVFFPWLLPSAVYIFYT